MWTSSCLRGGSFFSPETSVNSIIYMKQQLVTPHIEKLQSNITLQQNGTGILWGPHLQLTGLIEKDPFPGMQGCQTLSYFFLWALYRIKSTRPRCEICRNCELTSKNHFHSLIRTSHNKHGKIWTITQVTCVIQMARTLNSVKGPPKYEMCVNLMYKTIIFYTFFLLASYHHF